jgi:hypothetical protein
MVGGVLGRHVLYHSWMKSNGSPTMVLDTWQTTQ